jgi:hypothetical protein
VTRAAEGLTRIGSFFVEREIQDLNQDGAVVRSTLEKIWYRAPGLVRIAREITTIGTGAITRETIIRRPDLEYVSQNGSAYVRRNIAPNADLLPEPLSPTLAFYGVDDGPGPVIAGRATRRIVFETEVESRVAFVDAEQFTVLGNQESFVLSKESFVLGKVSKRPRIRKSTLQLRYGLAIPDERFAVPTGTRTIDGGFVARGLGDLRVAPRREPEGFERVRSGSDASGDTILYVKGALAILVKLEPAGSNVPVDLSLERSERITFLGRPATFVVGIYTLPRLAFEHRGSLVTVAAPLPRQALLNLAADMFEN